MNWNRYVARFSYNMWLAVAMAACALCVFLALTNFSKNSKQRLSLIDTVFYIPSGFCQQGQMANILYELFIKSFMLCLVDFFHICVVMWDFSSIHSRPHIHSKHSTNLLNLYDHSNCRSRTSINLSTNPLAHLHSN